MQKQAVLGSQIMTDDTVALIKTIVELFVAGGLGGLTMLIGQLIARRKSDAEARNTDAETDKQIPANAADTLANASAKLVAQYQGLLNEFQESTNKQITDMKLEIAENQKEICISKNEISELKDTLKHYARRITYLMTGIQMLIEQFKIAELVPCWKPNDWHSDMDKRTNDEPVNPLDKG